MTFWKSIIGIICLVFISTNVKAQIVWNTPVMTADSGDIIGVDLTVSGYQNIISAQGTIQFDESILEYSDVNNFALGSISINSFGDTEIDLGKLSFSWYESDLIGKDISDNDTVITVFFNVIGNPGDMSLIELVEIPVVVEFIDENFLEVPHNIINGSVTVNQTSSVLEQSILRELNVFPNPAKDWIQVEGDTKGKNLEVFWFNMEGKLMKSVALNSGEEENRITTEGLRSGMYHMRIGNKILGYDNRLIKIL